MKMFSRNHSLAAALMAAVTFGLPNMAYAKSYKDLCNKTDQQVIAGIAGATIGGVFGSQVAANGVRTEGSALGAIIGAATGAVLAGQVDCDDKGKKKKDRVVSTTTTTTSYHSGNSRRHDSHNRRDRSRSHRDGYYRTVHDSRSHTYRGHGSSYGYDYGYSKRRRLEYRLAYVKDEIKRLKDKRDYLERRRHYRYDPYLERKLYDLQCEIDRLRERKKAIKDRLKYASSGYYY